MRRLILALGASLGLSVATSLGAAGDTSLTQTTQVSLTCSDGHSVILDVDPTTLTNLTADVNSINASGTGLSCTLDPASIDPMSETTEWTVYDYNPSNHAIAPRNSPNSMPATTPDNGTTWQFNFRPNSYTALFTTTDSSATGDLSGKTLNDVITVSGSTGVFNSQHGFCDACATVRFYFRSPCASGPSDPPPGPPVNGVPPAGFYTQFWWSNPMSMNLATMSADTITASMSDPAEWSDWDGKRGTDPLVTAAFYEATQCVQAVGLSFGGGSFFENGVTFKYGTPPPPYETFSSKFSEW